MFKFNELYKLVTSSVLNLVFRLPGFCRNDKANVYKF